jgi:hypothetical protein
MYKTNAAGFGINWYRYNRMNYNIGFGLDNSDTGVFRGVAYFSSMRNPDTPRISDSHIMKTNYNGQTCKFCKAYPPNYIQVNLLAHKLDHLVQPDAQLRKLAWQAFNYGNILICNDSAVHCNGAALSNVQDPSEATAVKAATVHISPNPVSSTLHLQFKNIEPGNYDIMIVNRQGSIVLQKTNVYCDNSSTIDLNVAQLFSGFYLIRVSNGKNNIEQKLLKE